MIRPSDTLLLPSPEPSFDGDELEHYYRVLLRKLTSTPGRDGRQMHVLGITSCLPGEGVSTIVSNLAFFAAHEMNQRVLLVDTSPSQAAVVKAGCRRGGRGLYDLLCQGVSSGEVIQRTPTENLSVVPGGIVLDNHLTADDLKRLSRMLVVFKEHFDWVLFDLPTATEFNNCPALAGRMDGVMLVVEAERARNQVVQHAKQRLIEAGAHVVGIVFNKRRKHVPDWLYRRL